MKIQTSFVQDGKWWVTWTDDIPATLTQGATLEEARENLREESQEEGTQVEEHRVRLSNLANLDNFVSLLLLGIAWRVVHGFWLPEFYIT